VNMSQLVIERCDAESAIGGGGPHEAMKGDVGQGGSLWVVVGAGASVSAGQRTLTSLTGDTRKGSFEIKTGNKNEK